MIKLWTLIAISMGAYNHGTTTVIQTRMTYEACTAAVEYAKKLDTYANFYCLPITTN